MEISNKPDVHQRLDTARYDRDAFPGTDLSGVGYAGCFSGMTMTSWRRGNVTYLWRVPHVGAFGDGGAGFQTIATAELAIGVGNRWTSGVIFRVQTAGGYCLFACMTNNLRPN